MVPALFLLYINDLPQAVASNPLLYVDGTCIVVQHKGIIEFEKQLIKDFSSLRHWFANNKFTLQTIQDET